MTPTLFNYQKDALENLRSGSILCGGVGSGKSLTSLYYYYEKECLGYVDPENGSIDTPMVDPKDLYIITTARKRDTLEWDKECASFGLSKHEKTRQNVSLYIDSWNNIEKYVNVKNSFFIFDEQRVVGSGSWVKSFIKITKNNNWILLSATPGDTWMDYVPVFIANNFYKNRTEFIRNHVIFDRFVKYPKIKKYVNTSKLIEYRKQILIYMDYKKNTVSNHKKFLVEYDKNLYDTVTISRWNIYKSKPIENISELCYTWRKITNENPSRLEAISNILKMHNKLIIFYNFDYELAILKNFSNNINIPHSEWNGHAHMKIPTTSSWLYLVQYAAGAEGWNCIDTNCIVFYSQNYSYKIMHQAAGRIDRLNTPYKDLYYYHLYSKSPIDLAILKSLQNKKTFNETKFVPISFALET